MPWKFAMAVVLLPTIALAAEQRVAVKRMGECGSGCSIFGIEIIGRIDSNTLAEFTTATQDPRIAKKRLEIPKMLHLASPGGSVASAMAIGLLAREKGYQTFVGEGKTCASACVLILAAGVNRVPTGRIAIHRPRFDEEQFAKLTETEARKKYADMAEGVRSYLQKMGMHDGLFSEMMRVPSGKVRVLNGRKLKQYGLDGEDAAWAEWKRARAIASMGREDYEINQSYFAVVLACANRTSRGIDACMREVRPPFDSSLERCKVSTSVVPCVRAAAKRLQAQYQ